MSASCLTCEEELDIDGFWKHVQQGHSVAIPHDADHRPAWDPELEDDR